MRKTESDVESYHIYIRKKEFITPIMKCQPVSSISRCVSSSILVCLASSSANFFSFASYSNLRVNLGWFDPVPLSPITWRRIKGEEEGKILKTLQEQKKNIEKFWHCEQEQNANKKHWSQEHSLFLDELHSLVSDWVTRWEALQSRPNLNHN